MAVALMALFVALGGSATAAGLLITGKQIKNGSVAGVDIKNNTLKGVDIDESTLGSVPSAQQANRARSAISAHRAKDADTVDGLDSTDLRGMKGDKGDPGPQGPQGDAGPQGPEGPANPNAVNAQNADKLDNLDSTDFLRSDGKAVDADRLDGLDASSFVRGGGNVVRRYAEIAPGEELSVSTGLSNVKYTCPSEAWLANPGTVTYQNTGAGLAPVFIDDGSSVTFATAGVAPVTVSASADGAHTSIAALHQLEPDRTVLAHVFSEHVIAPGCAVLIQAIAN